MAGYRMDLPMYVVVWIYLVIGIVANTLLLWSYYYARYKVPPRPEPSGEREPEGIWVIPIHTHQAPTPKKDLN